MIFKVKVVRHEVVDQFDLERFIAVELVPNFCLCPMILICSCVTYMTNDTSLESYMNLEHISIIILVTFSMVFTQFTHL